MSHLCLFDKLLVFGGKYMNIDLRPFHSQLITWAEL